MKKSIMATLVGAIMFATVGCGSNDSNLTELEKIQEKGVLTIGTSADYPPYEFHSIVDGESKIVGMEMDVAAVIADELGVELEIKDMRFDGILAAVNSGTVDIGISGFTPTEERRQSINFSDQYYSGQAIILVKKENQDKFTSLEDFKDANITVQKGSLQEGIANDQIESTNLKTLSKIPEVIMDLQNDNADAVIISSTVAVGYLNEFEDLEKSNVDLADSGEGVAMAFKKNDDYTLIDKCNEILAELTQTGKIEEFVQNAMELTEE